MFRCVYRFTCEMFAYVSVSTFHAPLLILAERMLRGGPPVSYTTTADYYHQQLHFTHASLTTVLCIIHCLAMPKTYVIPTYLFNNA
jgi:hypothetical protein